MDVLGTVRSCGAPNFRQVRGGLTVFGMGQPSLLGFRQVLQKLQKDGHTVSTVTSEAGARPFDLGAVGPRKDDFRGSGGVWSCDREGGWQPGPSPSRP